MGGTKVRELIVNLELDVIIQSLCAEDPKKAKWKKRIEEFSRGE